MNLFSSALDHFYGICFLYITQFDRFLEFSLNESVREVADVFKTFKNTVGLTYGIFVLLKYPD